ncbi:MAG: hypothetical protein IT462_15290 [Planctomycetes bacterium]|nr:hypothetical protein [Planctomycetota bacterium]
MQNWFLWSMTALWLVLVGEFVWFTCWLLLDQRRHRRKEQLTLGAPDGAPCSVEEVLNENNPDSAVSSFGNADGLHTETNGFTPGEVGAEADSAASHLVESSPAAGGAANA